MSNRESARQEGVFIAVSESPDACKTPPANVPIPYRILADLGEALTVSPNVRYQGRPVVLADASTIAKVTGDEAGTGEGVKSGTHEGEVEFIQGSGTVFVNGKKIVREKDQVLMNSGNTKGRIQNLSGSAPAGGVAPGGQPMQPSNPPRRRSPESHLDRRPGPLD